MSLVSYGASSDEESEEENDLMISNQIAEHEVERKLVMNLPLPKQIETNCNLSVKMNLPEPKVGNIIFKEEDDEFLRKKAVSKIKPPPPNKSTKRITIPSLSSFTDDDYVPKEQNFTVKSNKLCGLLAILPKPKSEILFSKKDSSNSSETVKKNNFFVPYSVTNNKNSKLSVCLNVKNSEANLLCNYDSDDSDNESEKSNNEEDFFALTKVDKLPEVSQNEINAMVSKKAAEMAKVSNKFIKSSNVNTNYVKEDVCSEIPCNSDNSSSFLDSEALSKLCGSRLKRKRQEEINVVNLSHDQIIPSREDWMRNALAASTDYQPKGQLVDDDLTPGSKRKHQITYLAHQAKANESELQAMWALNRQTRRQTQSKYGF